MKIDEKEIKEYYENAKTEFKEAERMQKEDLCDAWYVGFKEGKVSALSWVLSHVKED